MPLVAVFEAVVSANYSNSKVTSSSRASAKVVQ